MRPLVSGGILKRSLRQPIAATVREVRIGRAPVANPLLPWPALIIAATALAVILPFFFKGNPSGHDFEFHLFSWMEVSSQWKQAIVYPRWAALAYWGYGEARFLFYPPASWTLGATLGSLLPWNVAPGAYVWLALSASGLSMFALARRWLSSGDAIFAAAVYAANPYYIVIVHWRSAFAELLAGALLPLLLLLVLRLNDEGRRIILPLAVVVAAAWLTNAPSAVMVNYSLALLLLVMALIHRSPRLLAFGGLAIVLGAALAAFYILPAAYEEKWVNIAQVLAPGVRPQDNFLFTVINDPDHNRFNLLVSIVAAAEMIALAGVAWLSRRWRAQQRALWWTLIAWALAAILLMFSFTSVFWQHLPKLRFVQLPWRWLLCLNVAFALLVTMGTRHVLSRIVICGAMLGVIVTVWHRVQQPWWDTAGDIAEMRDAFDPEGSSYGAPGYEGTDEYVPAGADSSEVNKDAPRVAVEGEGRARIHILQWAPESELFTADVSRPQNLVLRLFNYPAWKVTVNGETVDAESQETTGQMVIPVEAGQNRIQVRFVRTWDRTAGGWISVATAIILLGLLIWSRRRPAAGAPA